MAKDGVPRMPMADTSQIIEQIRKVQDQLRGLTGITASMFSASPSTYSAEDYGERRFLPITPKPRPEETEVTFTRNPMVVPQMKILESSVLTVLAEDWSQVRSPSRARRRMKQGHRQRVRHYLAPDPKLVYTDDSIIGHPETIRKLMKGLQERADALFLKAAKNAM